MQFKNRRAILATKFFGIFLVFLYAASCSSPSEKVIIPKAHAQSKKKTKKKKKKVSDEKILEKNKEPALVNTKPLKKIQKGQAKRFEEIQHYKYRKFIGEAIDGTLKLVEKARIPAAESKKIKDLVAEENEAREKLYKTIAKKNNYDKDMEKVLRESFFKSYREWDPKDSFFFIDGQWQQ